MDLYFNVFCQLNSIMVFSFSCLQTTLRVSICWHYCFEEGSSHLAQVGLERVILLSHPPCAGEIGIHYHIWLKGTFIVRKYFCMLFFHEFGIDPAHGMSRVRGRSCSTMSSQREGVCSSAVAGSYLGCSQL